MILTTKHPSAKDGRPIFYEDGRVVDDVSGIRWASAKYGEDNLASIMGVAPRTVENWRLKHRPISKPSLMLLKIHLDKKR